MFSLNHFFFQRKNGVKDLSLTNIACTHRLTVVCIRGFYSPTLVYREQKQRILPNDLQNAVQNIMWDRSKMTFKIK